MSQPSSPPPPSNQRTILFMVILSVSCAVILSILASALSEPQDVARELYRSKQMLVAARILNAEKGYFQIRDAQGNYIPAKLSAEGKLVPGSATDIPSQKEILEVFEKRFRRYLVNDQGKLSSFEEAGIEPNDYLKRYRKTGYYKEPWKLVYLIAPNDADKKTKSSDSSLSGIEGFLFPVNGYGLWDAIYGYIAVANDAETVIGISWYEHKETPGLGANISEWEWQKLFPNKKIFQASASGDKTDLATAPIGILVVRGKVSEVLGNVPKATSAVDGMSGATLTGNGVTLAYQESLGAYRPFLIEANKQFLQQAPSKD